MSREELITRGIEKEFSFKSSRSSGPGGQNVNKVSSRVELRFSVPGSKILSRSEKAVLAEKLGRRLTSAGEIIITSQSERSQYGNKKKAADKLCSLLAKALTIYPARIPTRPSAASRKARQNSKKHRSAVKRSRGKIASAEE